MITTKSGSRDEGIGITYQLMASQQTPLITPDFQTRFSQGSNGNFGQLSDLSWGAPMKGQTVTNFLGQEQILQAGRAHPYDDFFRTVSNIDHSLSIDKRGETSGVLFSAAWNQSDGMIPTNETDRKSFNIRYDSQITDYLTLMHGPTIYTSRPITDPTWPHRPIIPFI